MATQLHTEFIPQAVTMAPPQSEKPKTEKPKTKKKLVRRTGRDYSQALGAVSNSRSYS